MTNKDQPAIDNLFVKEGCEEFQLEELIVSTTVLRKWKVSTRYRQPSAQINSPPWFYELLVWSLNSDGTSNILELQIGKNSKATAISLHFGVCQTLLYEGKLDENGYE